MRKGSGCFDLGKKTEMNSYKDRFTPHMFRRLLVPSLISSVGLAFADMADAIVIGRSMGAVGLAAISLSLPLYMVFNVFMHGLGIGGSVRFSQLMGEGRKEEAIRCYNRVMQAGILLGVVIAAIVNIFPDMILRIFGTVQSDGALYDASRSYVCLIALGAPLFFINYMLNYFLRNDNSERLAGAGFLIGNAVDIVLNVVFVFCFDMGTAGAAIATLAGLAVGIVCYLPGIFSSGHFLYPAWKGIDVKEVFSCLKTGLATSSQYLFQMIFLLIANNVLMTLAAEKGVAVFDLLQNASYLILYLYEGTGKAMQPLVSTFYGEKNGRAAGYTLRLGLVRGILAGSAAALVIFIFPEVICGIFGLQERGLVHMGTQALRIYCAGSVFAGMSIILETYYQSEGEEKSAFVIAFLRGCAVLLPCTVLFSFLSLEKFWWLYPANEVVSLGIFLICRQRLRKEKEFFDPARVFSRTIQSRREEAAGMAEGIESFCDRWNASGKQKYLVMMAVEEVCLAIITRAFGKGKSGVIQVTVLALENGEFELHIRDNAVIFNPFSLQTAQADKDTGIDMDAMGILVIRSQAKDFFYRHYQGFNTLMIRI